MFRCISIVQRIPFPTRCIPSGMPASGATFPPSVRKSLWQSHNSEENRLPWMSEAIDLRKEKDFLTRVTEYQTKVCSPEIRGRQKLH
jgi:hypothetical protein